VAAGTAAWQAGLPDRAEGLLAEALALDPPVPVRVRADAVRGDIAVKCGSPARARDLLSTAAADADPDTAVSLLAEAVYACFALADARSALRAAADVDRLLPYTTDPAVQIIGRLARGVADVLAGGGGADQLRPAVRRLAAGPEHHADPRLLVWMVIGPLFLRESGTGRALIGRAMRQTRDSAAVGMLPALLFHLARDDATTERWANAETAYDEAIRLSRESGQTTQLGMSLAGLAWLHAHQGREQDCRRRAAEAIRLATEHDLRLAHGWALFALGDLELCRGAAADALVHYERLRQLLDEAGVLDPDLSPAPELTDVLLRLGRVDEAGRIAEAYAVTAAAKGRPWALARACRATGLTGSDDALDEHFGAALDQHARTPDVFETARTRLGYGARLRRARRRVDAREQLRAAVAAFDDLGAAGWADVAAAELKATGETARRREPSTAADLTAQERQIALLLSDGLSTREAAAALFLSPKTVEYHLRKVYTKLGIHSRAELAAHL
jgi:DNA-binding CsgD family transcriptional regulator